MRPTTIYCDVDGTLTDKADGRWGNLRQDVAESLRSVIAAGHCVIVWSAQGADYAKAFCRRYHLHPSLCLGKPDVYVDDRKDIRPAAKMKHLLPEEMGSWFAKEALK